MTSAVNPWDTESQPSVGHRLACHICLILFGRMVAPPALLIDPTNGSIPIKLKRPPEARAAEQAMTHFYRNGIFRPSAVSTIVVPNAALRDLMSSVMARKTSPVASCVGKEWR